MAAGATGRARGEQMNTRLSGIGMTSQRTRLRMVERLRAEGIRDEVVLAAMGEIPRHIFVDEALASRAYDDVSLPIGFGQTISQPYIVAYMTEIVNPQTTHRVLEIGTGSGYQAAVLANIVKEVYTIEIIDTLSRQAATLFNKLNYKNITVKTGDGYYGWKEKSPFDAIIVTAAAEHIPPPLIRQLKDGGKMVIPVGSSFMTQMLILVEKKKDATTSRNLIPVAFVPLTRKK